MSAFSCVAMRLTSATDPLTSGDYQLVRLLLAKLAEIQTREAFVNCVFVGNAARESLLAEDAARPVWECMNDFWFHCSPPFLVSLLCVRSPTALLLLRQMHQLVQALRRAA